MTRVKKIGINATEEMIDDSPGTKAMLEKPTSERLIKLASGFELPLIVGAAVQHRVFDLLEQEPKTPEQVASESGASLRGIRAVMNALIGLKLLRKDDAGRYALTPESAAFLVRGKPQFLGALLGGVQIKWRAAAAETGRWRMWLDINDVVRAGKPAAPVNLEQHGGEYFKGFVEALFATHYRAARALAEALAIAHKEKPVRVLDLAAGSGVWGIVLAREFPHATVTAVDWSNVLEITKAVVRRGAFYTDSSLSRGICYLQISARVTTSRFLGISCTPRAQPGAQLY